MIMMSEVEKEEVLTNISSAVGSVQEKINQTAYGVAYLRSCETAWFADPFAAVLAGESGKTWMEAVCTMRVRDRQESPELTRARFHNAIASRTRKIDEEIASSVTEWLPRVGSAAVQVVVLGAGLDTRPWRLNIAADISDLQQLRYFEVDYEDIFAYKLSCLGEERVQSSPFRYRHVSTDLSQPLWQDTLIDAGFDPKCRTIWLLEGLTGYLYEGDNLHLFLSIAQLSATGSRVLATFLTPASASLRIPLHRFICDDPIAFVSMAGWEKDVKAWDIEDLATSFGRRSEQPERGYVLVSAYKL